MDKQQYTTSEQFVIQFYRWYKLQEQMQQYLVEDKSEAKALVREVR